MDKIVGLCVTIFIGIPLMVVSMVISWWMNDGMDEREYDDDSDVRLYHVVRDRKYRSMDRNHKGDKK